MSRGSGTLGYGAFGSNTPQGTPRLNLLVSSSPLRFVHILKKTTSPEPDLRYTNNFPPVAPDDLRSDNTDKTKIMNKKEYENKNETKRQRQRRRKRERKTKLTENN